MQHSSSMRYVHTHAHTLLYTLSIKDVGQDLEMMLLCSDRFGLAFDTYTHTHAHTHTHTHTHTHVHTQYNLVHHRQRCTRP